MSKPHFAIDQSQVKPPQAVLVMVDFGTHDVPESMQELASLVDSLGVLPVDQLTCKRSQPDPKYFIGSGKAQELVQCILERSANLVVFNHDISPTQQRNLEQLLNCHVLDRTGLILEIFAKRAKSHIGQVQVQLARARYQSSRLVRAWSHLERQTGGIGIRGGPGETQLELDRRMLMQKIKQLQSQLQKLQKQHQTQTQARRRNQVMTVAIVGYTNAGKSTLFNALTKANVYAKDQLFATLDTTSRKVFIDGVHVILSDTVGFIRDLPHQLVESFAATLQETVEADLLLHVIDFQSPIKDDQIANVNAVLKDIGALNIPQIRVMNKIDGLPLEQQTDLLNKSANSTDSYPTIFISAQKNIGLDRLRSVIAKFANLQNI